jgi:hypothetical protein
LIPEREGIQMTTTCLAYYNGVEDIRDNDNVMSLKVGEDTLRNFFIPLDNAMVIDMLDYTHYQVNKGVTQYFRLSIVQE